MMGLLEGIFRAYTAKERARNNADFCSGVIATKNWSDEEKRAEAVFEGYMNAVLNAVELPDDDEAFNSWGEDWKLLVAIAAKWEAYKVTQISASPRKRENAVDAKTKCEIAIYEAMEAKRWTA